MPSKQAFRLSLPWVLVLFCRFASAEIVDVQNNDAPAPNLPRVMVAPDGAQRLGSWLLLDGSGSKDPAGAALEFEWRQVEGPPLALSSEELRRPQLWIFFSEAGDYRLSLRARNQAGWSRPAELKLSVAPGLAEIPLAEGRQICGAGELVKLPGEGWRQAAGPEVLLRPAETGVCCRPMRSGLYIFEALRAGDVAERRGVSVPSGREADCGDRRPLAKFATRDPSGRPHAAVLLDASLSRDPDGPEETAALKPCWTTPDRDRGVELTPLPGLCARFTAPRPGVYGVTLTVSDDRLESTPETIFIRVEKALEEDAPERETALDWEDAGAPQTADVRFNRVRLGLWESNLQRAVDLFPSHCGAALRIDPEVAPPGTYGKVPLHLEVRDAALLHLLDWIARQTQACYRREANGSFWLMRPTGWVKGEKLRSVVLPVDALYEQKDGSDLTGPLFAPFLRIVAAQPGLTLAFDPVRQEIQGVLPISVGSRLKEICATLRQADTLPIVPPDFLTDAEAALRRTLAEKSVTLRARGRRLDYLLRDLSAEAGVATGFDPRQFPKGLPRIDVDIQDAPLRDAVRTLVAAAGFDGCSAEAPEGLWFYKGDAPYPGGELLWDQTFVRTYDVGRILAGVAPLNGEALIYAIKRRIYPASWKDPAALCFYHAPTHRLVVMHGEAAQRKIGAFLTDLMERGEAALGPVEEAAH